MSLRTQPIISIAAKFSCRYDGSALNPVYELPPFSGKLPSVSGEDLKDYTGGCHCGDVAIAVKSKPLSEVDVAEDNCSICARVSLSALLHVNLVLPKRQNL